MHFENKKQPQYKSCSLGKSVNLNLFHKTKERVETSYQHSGRTFRSLQDGQIPFFVAVEPPSSSSSVFPPPSIRA